MIMVSSQTMLSVHIHLVHSLQVQAPVRAHFLAPDAVCAPDLVPLAVRAEDDAVDDRPRDDAELLDQVPGRTFEHGDEDDHDHDHELGMGKGTSRQCICACR